MLKSHKKVFSVICSVSFCLLFYSFNAFAAVRDVKITIIGRREAGKTALRNRLTKNDFNFLVRTQTERSDFITDVIDSQDPNVKLFLRLWDTSGNEDVKNPILKERIKGSHFVVISVDLSSGVKNPRYDNIIREAIEEWYVAVRENSPASEVIIVGTKLDKLDDARREAMLEMLSAARSYYTDFTFHLTSAQTGFGLQEFYDIIKQKTDATKLKVPGYVDYGAADDACAAKCGVCGKNFNDRTSKYKNCCDKCLIFCKAPKCKELVTPKKNFSVYCAKCWNEYLKPCKCKCGCDKKLEPDQGKYCRSCEKTCFHCCARGNCTTKIDIKETYCDYHNSWFKRLFRWGL